MRSNPVKYSNSPPKRSAVHEQSPLPMLIFYLHKVMAYGVFRGKQPNSYSESGSGRFMSKLGNPLPYVRPWCAYLWPISVHFSHPTNLLLTSNVRQHTLVYMLWVSWRFTTAGTRSVASTRKVLTTPIGVPTPNPFDNKWTTFRFGIMDSQCESVTGSARSWFVLMSSCLPPKRVHMQCST